MIATKIEDFNIQMLVVLSCVGQTLEYGEFAKSKRRLRMLFVRRITLLKKDKAIRIMRINTKKQRRF